jgi:AcrR family transcriptional regulator
MGSKERRQRHRTRIREAILATARELFVAEGVRNVSLRQIADRIEYSPLALYTYSCCKDDIFLVLARRRRCGP